MNAASLGISMTMVVLAGVLGMLLLKPEPPTCNPQFKQGEVVQLALDESRAQIGRVRCSVNGPLYDATRMSPDGTPEAYTGKAEFFFEPVVGGDLGEEETRTY